MDQRRVLLAVDGQKSAMSAIGLIANVMKGPMSPFVAGVKFNDVLHAGWGGQLLVDTIYGTWPELKVMDDLKLCDVGATDINTLKHYVRDSKEFIVTIMVHVDAGGFLQIQQQVEGAKIAVMGIPSDMSEEDCVERYGGPPSVVMERWLSVLELQFQRLVEAPDGRPSKMHAGQYAISSYDMMDMYKERFPWLRLIVPGIRDIWMLGNKAGQKRITGTVDALLAGAFYVVMGNQLFKGSPDDGVSAEESQQRTADALDEYFAKAA